MKIAQVLIEALPYIKHFYGKLFLIKCGGRIITEAKLLETFSQDIVLLAHVGIRPIIVHGGKELISTYTKKYLRREAEFIDGKRVTDKNTLEVAQMVLIGKLAKLLVAKICKSGGKAIGISGIDGDFIIAKKQHALKFAGEIESLNTNFIMNLVKSELIPIISPIGIDYTHSTPINLNADSVAGEVARCLKVNKLIILTDTKGILKDPTDENSLISSMSASELDEFIKKDTTDPTILPKLNAAKVALSGGVKKVHIIDGRQEHSILLELFTDKGIGTQIIP